MLIIGTWSSFWHGLTEYLSLELGVIAGVVVLTAGGAIFRRMRRRSASEATAAPPGETTARPDAERRRAEGQQRESEYLQDVIRRGSTLSFGDPASWTLDETKNAGLVTLDEVWTPLRVADSQKRVGKVGTHESMAEDDTGAELWELFESNSDPLLILGDPGSGKSTSAARFAVDAAVNRTQKHGSGLLPIWVSLGTVVVGPKAEPEAVILSGVPEIERATARTGAEGGRWLAEFLATAITDGKALLLLDGLDEVKEHALSSVRSAISDVVHRRNGTRVVATCRKFDYRQSAPNRKIPIDRELELLPFSVEEKNQYVDRWYGAAVRIGRFTSTEADDLRAALKVELRSEGLSELASLPLLLALLTLIHSEEAKLPDSTAVVCDRAIKYMLADAPKWRLREAGAVTVASGPILSLAIELAHQRHVEDEVADGDGDVGVTEKMVIDEATTICETLARVDARRLTLRPADLAERFLNSHGLLLEIGQTRYRFAHRYFQEFLAGQHYAQGAHREEAVSRGASTHWREPFRLMASFAGHEGENLFYILALIDELLAVPGPSGLPSSQLAAEMLAEIGRRRLALRQFGSVLDEGKTGSHSGTEGLWPRARVRVAGHAENDTLTLSERERSASVLGALGDPRFVSAEGVPVGPWDCLVEIEGGSSRVGSTRLDASAMIGGWVGDVRTLEFAPFAIGRYPVTNAVFRAFVEGDGYTNMAYWKGAFAGGWVSGDPVILDVMRKHWLSTATEHHAKEIRDKEIDIATLEEECERRTAPRRAPYYWGDRRFNAPNQPVVGINWWEAAAFCEWATAAGRRSGAVGPTELITLPTEFEWERASRPVPDDRIYPWGDSWVESKAHVSTNALNMRQPAPVGIYLEPWPGGPCDLAGNVWEWTASLFFPYAAEHDAERLASDSLEMRVVRGSSWYNMANLAACSARAVDRSYNLFYDVGFRIARTGESVARAGCS